MLAGALGDLAQRRAGWMIGKQPGSAHLFLGGTQRGDVTAQTSYHELRWAGQIWALFLAVGVGDDGAAKIVIGWISWLHATTTTTNKCEIAAQGPTDDVMGGGGFGVGAASRKTTSLLWGCRERRTSVVADAVMWVVVVVVVVVVAGVDGPVLGNDGHITASFEASVLPRLVKVGFPPARGQRPLWITVSMDSKRRFNPPARGLAGHRPASVSDRTYYAAIDRLTVHPHVATSWRQRDC